MFLHNFRGYSFRELGTAVTSVGSRQGYPPTLWLAAKEEPVESLEHVPAKRNWKERRVRDTREYDEVDKGAWKNRGRSLPISRLYSVGH
jgi:hypothetical protein